LKSKYQSHK